MNNAPANVYKYSALTEDFPSGQNFPDHSLYHQNFTSPKLSHVRIVIQVSTGHSWKVENYWASLNESQPNKENSTVVSARTIAVKNGITTHYSI